MKSIAEKIHESHLLTDIFGRWPSFHDAEVVSMELCRNLTGIPRPTLKARIHAFEMTSEVNNRGYYVLRNHVLVGFIFRAIDEFSMNGFNQQNALWSLDILDITSRQLEFLEFEVHFASSFGVEATFKCHSVEIETVEAYTPERNESVPRQSGPRPGEFKHN
ncbi:MAG TPA: Imm50 family immunity protein [Candidatus Angelobacter sp.]|jgi:hypothetical protein